MAAGTEPLELLYAARFPSYFKLLVLKTQELNLSMEHPSLLFLFTCDKLFFTVHFGKQRVCCILSWWCLQRQQGLTSSDQLCVTNESLQDATLLSGNFGNEKFFFLRFHCVLVDKGEISRCKLRSQWPKESSQSSRKALEMKLRVWVISKDSCLLDVFHFPVNEMIRRRFCWGLGS